MSGNGNASTFAIPFLSSLQFASNTGVRIGDRVYSRICFAGLICFALVFRFVRRFQPSFVVSLCFEPIYSVSVGPI